MADNKNSLRHELTKGIIKENPVLVMLLGMCPDACRYDTG